ncbi:MAG: phage terminase large subunit [Clostridia bacterium]|nr:phage terminase large subunit [Clostridia bacterium]MBQ5900794.1 phage terminase large subunit [Clostridia bacterium]
MTNLNHEYIGNLLVKQGFEKWFRYMFRVIEGQPFIVEPIHEGLFEYMDKLYKGEVTRLNINIPPRAGKTTMAKYLLVYALTVNPKANIIYTSFSQSLLTDIATSVHNILEHPIYKSMYPTNIAFDNDEINPIDDFWAEYLRKENGKNTYSAKRIMTAQGGVVLFSAIGGQITGYGAGLRNAIGFTGCLIIDDANKPADIHSFIMRSKVVRYFEETLLSRLNNSNVPIVNIQQRLHLEDLSGILAERYGFITLKRPLIDENGVCQLPRQYSPERIKELQINTYMFVSQYQQEPIVLGGAVIKSEWFKYYPVNQPIKYKRIIITGDTALKVKEYNDYSVFGVWGLTEQNKMRLLDLVRGKWEAPDLKRQVVALWNRWQINSESFANALYIEDKASGIGLIQELQVAGVPVLPLVADKDKLTRVENALPYIEAGLVELPESRDYSFVKEFVAECEAFTRDDSHAHDDQVDILAYAVQVLLSNTTVSILDVL